VDGPQAVARQVGRPPSPVSIEPRHYARQAFFITLLNPEAIVFYMAFSLFIDRATHRGVVTFGAMAATIALITAIYCLSLCAFAGAVATKVRAHRRMTHWLERVVGGSSWDLGAADARLSPSKD